MNSHSSYPVLLFDFDGTLADTRAAICWSLSAAFQEAGLPRLEKETTHTAIAQGWSLDESLHYLQTQLAKAQDALAKIKKRYRHVYATEGWSQMKPYPKAGAGPGARKEGGATLILVSNKGIGALKQAFKLWNWDHHFNIILADGGFPGRQLP